MKKLLLATAIATLSISAAQAAPKVYGNLHLGVDYIDLKPSAGSASVGVEKAGTTVLNSNASRIGVKGEDELTATTSVVYMAEWGINGDTAGADLKGRNRFVGLKNTNLGTLRLGAYDTALKEAQGKVDLLNDMVGGQADMGAIFAGENRADNVIGYESPDMDGFPVKFNANVILEEAPHNSENGLSLSLAYNANGVYAAIAGDKKVKSKYNATGAPALPGVPATVVNAPLNLASDIIRVVGQVDMGQAAGINGLTLGALYQNAKPSTSSSTTGDVDKENSFLISGLMAIPAVDGLSGLVQYEESKTTYVNDPDKSKLSQIAAGLAYSLAKNTTTYGYIAQQQNKYAGDSDKVNVIGVSLNHKF